MLTYSFPQEEVTISVHEMSKLTIEYTKTRLKFDKWRFSKKL